MSEEKIKVDFCPFCGKKIEIADVCFCPHCGRKIFDFQVKNGENDNKERSSNWNLNRSTVTAKWPKYIPLVLALIGIILTLSFVAFRPFILIKDTLMGEESLRVNTFSMILSLLSQKPIIEDVWLANDTLLISIFFVILVVINVVHFLECIKVDDISREYFVFHFIFTLIETILSVVLYFLYKGFIKDNGMDIGVIEGLTTAQTNVYAIMITNVSLCVVSLLACVFYHPLANLQTVERENRSNLPKWVYRAIVPLLLGLSAVLNSIFIFLTPFIKGVDNLLGEELINISGVDCIISLFSSNVIDDVFNNSILYFHIVGVCKIFILAVLIFQLAIALMRAGSYRKWDVRFGLITSICQLVLSAIILICHQMILQNSSEGAGLVGEFINLKSGTIWLLISNCAILLFSIFVDLTFDKAKGHGIENKFEEKFDFRVSKTLLITALVWVFALMFPGVIYSDMEFLPKSMFGWITLKKETAPVWNGFFQFPQRIQIILLIIFVFTLILSISRMGSNDVITTGFAKSFTIGGICIWSVYLIVLVISLFLKYEFKQPVDYFFNTEEKQLKSELALYIGLAIVGLGFSIISYIKVKSVIFDVQNDTKKYCNKTVYDVISKSNTPEEKEKYIKSDKFLEDMQKLYDSKLIDEEGYKKAREKHFAAIEEDGKEDKKS